MAAQRPYSEKVEENSMAARKSGHSEGSGVSQVLKELADTIGKAMGRSAELSKCSSRACALPKHDSDRAESLYL